MLTVVDLKHVRGQLARSPEAEKQIAIADKLIFNKRDLVDDAQFAAAVAAVERLNPFSVKEVTTHGALPVDRLLDLDLFEPKRRDDMVGAWIGADRPADADHAHDDHVHTPGVGAVCLQSREPLEWNALLRFFLELSHEKGEDLFRVKGMVHFQNVEKPVIIQGVQATFSPPTYAEAWPRGEVETRIVVIGRDLDRADMEARFAACAARRGDRARPRPRRHLTTRPQRESAMSFAYMTATELKGLLAARSISPVELVEDTLERQEALELRINAFVTRTPEQALDAARAQERTIAAGEGGAIAGLPVSVKDLVAVAGVPWTFGSRPFADNVPDFDAPAVERIRQAGGCIIGKSTTSEFGCKAVTDSPLTGITRNPWNLAKTPGGSSGGAGASVAAGLTPFALATDGGGSVRIPSALCGLFGIKAQFGRVPVFPVSAAPTLAHVGSIARTVRDAALLLGVMAGHDRRDAFGVAEPVPDFLAACDKGAGGLRIAWSPTLGYARPSLRSRPSARPRRGASRTSAAPSSVWRTPSARTRSRSGWRSSTAASAPSWRAC